MRFSIIALATPLFMAASQSHVTHSSAFAGFNCKCQDANGQYNPSTEFCCGAQNDLTGIISNKYHDDQVHQCSNSAGGINNGQFVVCCQSLGHGGAFCWN